MDKTTFIEDIAEKIDTIEMPFKAMTRKKTTGQTFGRPKLTKAGKEFDVFDWIQSGREDTEIYPTLEKYGCLDRMELDTEGVFADLSQIKDLRGLINQTNAAQELWDALPLDVRNEFQNNKEIFLENGENWLKKKLDEAKKETTGTNIKEEITNAQ